MPQVTARIRTNDRRFSPVTTSQGEAWSREQLEARQEALRLERDAERYAAKVAAERIGKMPTITDKTYGAGRESVEIVPADGTWDDVFDLLKGHRRVQVEYAPNEFIAPNGDEFTMGTAGRRAYEEAVKRGLVISQTANEDSLQTVKDGLGLTFVDTAEVRNATLGHLSKTWLETAERLGVITDDQRAQLAKRRADEAAADEADEDDEVEAA